ncbi:ThuA domain-containing protein, partial [Microbispora tritici]
MPKAAKVLLSASAAAAALVASVSLPTAVHAADPAYKVLVFSKTAAFRHDSIPTGIQAIRDLGAANNFTVDATEDANAFTSGNLAQYKAVVFLSTTGDVLNATQQTAFQSYVDGGGGYVGVHSAADTEYDWPYYGQLVGAWFNNHP